MIAFVDIETTGLDPERHEIWEVGIVREDGYERDWKLSVTLLNADMQALEIGRWAEAGPTYDPAPGSVVGARFEVLNALAGNVFAGNNPAFDAAFLRRFLGSAPWHYHLVDVKALCVGRLAAQGLILDKEGTIAPYDTTPPWATADLLKAAGLPGTVAHRALDDAKQARALYNWAMR